MIFKEGGAMNEYDDTRGQIIKNQQNEEFARIHLAEFMSDEEFRNFFRRVKEETENGGNSEAN